MRDGIAAPPRPKTVWEYRNADGTMFCCAERIETAGGKRFLQFHFAPDGQKLWKRPDGPAPPYNLERIKSHALVLVVEGEKAADAAQKRFPGMAATTSLGGASSPAKTDWAPLRGKHVTIWPDSDCPGQKYAHDVAFHCLAAGAATVSVVNVPHDAPPGWDLADDPPPGWNLGAMLDDAPPYRSDAAESLAVHDGCAPPEPVYAEPHEEPEATNQSWRSAASYKCSNVEWLWEGRLLHGRINLLAGMGDVGKDVLCCTIASHVSTGRAWPDGKPCRQGKVGYVMSEDEPEDTIVPRLVAAGADLSNVLIWSLATPPKPEDLDGLALLIVSPLVEILPDGKDANADRDARQFIQPWKERARQIGCTIIGIVHYNKKNDLAAVQRILGSVGLPNALRNTLCVEVDNEDDERRLFLKLKGNLSPTKKDGLAYRIEKVGELSQSIACVWEEGFVTKTADDVIAAKRQNGSKQSARDWLVEYLKRNGGMQEARVIYAAAEKEGYSEDAVEKARRRAGILSVKHEFNGGWWWQFSKLPSSALVDGL